MRTPTTKPPRHLAGLAALICAAAPALASAHGKPHDPPHLSPASPATLIGTCEALQAQLAGLPNTVITGSSTIAAGTLQVAGQPVLAHCRVTGRMNDRIGIDGRPYAIGFELRLPIEWNGRFFYQGNGGIDGAVVPATGAVGGGPLTHALAQGFAVLSSDAGHPGAYGPSFGFDPQARLDYGYQAVGTLTPMAKAAINVAYGKRPDRSYIGGCSNGGRHVLVAAARYADQYDGFLAGAPGFNLPLAALANIWSAQRYASVAAGDPATPAGLETAFTADERRTVAAAVLERCDRLDGVRDGLVQDTRLCQKVFNLKRDVPTCDGERDGTCLSREQKLAIGPIFRGARSSDGPFYASFPYDPGIAGAGVPVWEFIAPLVLDSGAVGVIFKVPPTADALTNGPAFALNLDIDTALAQLFTTDATFTESARSIGPAPTRREGVGLSRCLRSYLLDRRHDALVARRESREPRARRRLRACVSHTGHEPLRRRPGHRPGGLHHAARGLGGARPGSGQDRRHCPRAGQCGRREPGSAGRLVGGSYAPAVPLSFGGALRAGQCRAGVELHLPARPAMTRGCYSSP
jgi:feruloyl esterase